MNTIADQWKLWEGLCMPKDAGPVQRQEMRRVTLTSQELRELTGYTQPARHRMGCRT